MPFLPAVPGTGAPVQLFDSATGVVRAVTPGPTARLYVCGITPYDATHMGHAATYVTFDVLGRALRDAGHEVDYVQNITDVDDPLLERAARDWHDVAGPGCRGGGAVPRGHDRAGRHPAGPLRRRRREHRARSRPRSAGCVEAGAAYAVQTPESAGNDVYLDLTSDPGFGVGVRLDP